MISDSVGRNNEIIFFCLAHLDGILEDNRSRIKYYMALMTQDFKNPLNMIKILVDFIQKSQEQSHRDIASHILVLLIDAHKYEKCESDARHFMNLITNGIINENSYLSPNALTFALMTLVKTNQLAMEFANPLGFNLLNELLEGACMNNA